MPAALFRFRWLASGPCNDACWVTILVLSGALVAFAVFGLLTADE